MPSGYKASLSSRYVIWVDNAGSHLRVTTASPLTDFQGKIEAIDGKIVSMILVSIFIGAKGVHPKGGVVLLPAKPGKK